MDANEKRGIEIKEIEKVYNIIEIISCSKFGDNVPLCKPNQKWLECNLEENKLKKNRNEKNPDPINVHVESITIESLKANKFPILIDGELCGPYHKVVITKSSQSFNLKTFNNILN
jgi:hypothetical protein